MHEMGNDSESGSGVEASSIAVDAKQQETEPMKNTSGRVLIGHTSDTSDSNISSRDDNILKKEESSRMRKSTQAEANLSNRTDSDSGKIQHKNLAGSRVKTKNGSVSHANQSANQVHPSVYNSDTESNRQQEQKNQITTEKGGRYDYGISCYKRPKGRD